VTATTTPVPVTGNPNLKDPVAGGVLPRNLGAVSAIGTLIAIIIGSGIYRVPSAVAGYVPSPVWFMLVWVVGGGLALCGALMFGEYAGMFPDAGGRYVYLREGVGQVPAFAYAWTNSILLHPVGLGARALLLAAYLGTVVPSLADSQQVVAAGVLLLITIANYRSTLFGATLATVTSAAKLLGLAALAIAILVTAAPVETAAPVATLPLSARGFGLALVTVMWTYSGWGNTTYLTGEVKRGERTMPLVLAGGVIGVVLLFLMVNLAYLHALPMSDIAASDAVAAEAAGRMFGTTGTRIVGVLVVVSIFGSLCGTLLASPRMTYAMGRDMARLSRLASVHPKYGTPHVSVAVSTVLGIAFLWNHTFEQLAESYILGSWPFYILCAVGFFLLRRRRPELPRPFRTPGYPVIPAFFLVSATAMVINAAADDPRRAVLGSLLILSSVPVYFVLRGARSKGGG
jgi:APA family basic amino acid/polyamine antiporter